LFILFIFVKGELVVDVASVTFLEGPVYDVSSDSIFFSDIPNDRILRLANASSDDLHMVSWKATTEWRKGTGKSNGLLFDEKGRLIMCESVGRRVSRLELDGSITVLASSFQGNPFNSPNDLTMDYMGRVYFTDPSYGMKIDDIKMKQSVYRIDFDLDRPFVVARIIDDLDMPNGIAMSFDQSTLYVIDASTKENKLWGYRMQPDGNIVGVRTLIHDFLGPKGPDGMCFEKHSGFLYVAAGLNLHESINKAGIYVIDPKTSTQVGFIPIPEDTVTNCCIGGKNGEFLFVTAGKTLFKIKFSDLQFATQQTTSGNGAIIIAVVIVIPVVIVAVISGAALYWKFKAKKKFQRIPFEELEELET